MKSGGEYGIKMSFCKDCIKNQECDIEVPCKAIRLLTRVLHETSQEYKKEQIEEYKKELLWDYAAESEELKLLGESIIQKFERFEFIIDYEIDIGYVISYEKKRHNKRDLYGKCEKVSKENKAFIPYDFIITLYEPNIELLSTNQQKIVMYHELMHIGIGAKGLKINDHTINDFTHIIKQFGYNWSDWVEMGEEVPDILGGEYNE